MPIESFSLRIIYFGAIDNVKFLALGFRLVISIFVGLFCGTFISLFFVVFVPDNEIVRVLSPLILFASYVGPAVLVFKGTNSDKDSNQIPNLETRVEDIKIDKVDEKPEI